MIYIVEIGVKTQTGEFVYPTKLGTELAKKGFHMISPTNRAAPCTALFMDL